ncbi:MAG: DUF2065 domain-containing protein [Zoogloeaceae bacterium]|jgi:uncharacterized protein YjeT (DUF2065 family)|nr:DUF2065 domain-containing protein [Zoogloeaceae bacterium]
MMQTLLLAFALMLVIEGVMPFVAPAVWREALRWLAQLSDGQIRFCGLSFILLGLTLWVILQMAFR